MSEEWKTCPLSDIADIIMGTSPPSSSYNTTGEGVPLVNGPVEFGGLSPFDLTVKTKFTTEPKRHCKQNDLILCVRGSTTGRMNIAGHDSAIGRGVAAIRADGYQPWVNHFLSYNRKVIYDLGTGATFPNVSARILADLSIPDPPLREQKRIVSILDEAFGAIAKAKENAARNLANAQELFDSYLNRVFTQKGEGWEESTLGEVAENWDRQRKPITKSKRRPGEIPYYGASGIVDYVEEHLFDEPLLLISEDGANLLARTYPIAFSVSGKTWVNNHAHVLKFDSFQTQRIVEFFMNSISVEPWVSGMAQPKLNQTKLNSIPVPIAPPANQVEIVADLEAIQENVKCLSRICQQKLTALDELKQSILQKAFTGQLTANSPELESVG